MTLFFLLLSITIFEEIREDFGCARLALYNPLKLKEMEFTEHLIRAREGFVGRQWLFKDISNSLERDDSKGVMIIAAPGFGKSALVSNLICSKLSNYTLHSQILGYHLCIHSHKNTQNGAKFVRNLANMIAHSLQDYERLMMSDQFLQGKLEYEQCSSDPTGCFEQQILSPLKNLQLRFSKTMYIVIDALDECYNENDKGTSIVNILSNNMNMFPNWLKVIVTSRNVSEIRRKFSCLDFIELHSDDPRNLQDIEHFILLQPKIRNEDFPVQAMVNKSQGNFLYIKLVLKYLKSKGLRAGVESWNSLPTTLNSIYQEFLERKFKTNDRFKGSREIFEILVATLSPLSTEELYEVLLTKYKNSKKFSFDYDYLPMLEDLSMYLSSVQEKQIVTVFHNSLTEWLTSVSNRGGMYYVDEKEGNRLLADYHFKKIDDKSVIITTQLIHELATYVIKGNFAQHKQRFNDLDPEIINTTDRRSNFTALHLAATSDNTNILEILVPFFQKVDCKESNGRTPAFFAVTSGNLDGLRLLYEKGASLDVVTNPLPLAPGISGEFEKMKDCKFQMCEYTLLHVAAQQGHVDVLEFLLANNVSISSLSGTGSSAIHLASEFGHTKILESLLKHGAVADNLCLYYAALRGKAEAVRLLFQHGIKDDCIDCISTYIEHVGKMCTRMFYDNCTRRCNTALHAAAIGDFPDVIELLLASKENALHCINYYGKEPLHEAVEHNNYKAAEVLLDFKANSSGVCKFIPSNNLHQPQKLCPCGYTPLHLAAHHGFAALTNLLLQYKAEYNATDCEGMQPIHVASCQGHANIIAILVENGVDVNSNSSKNMTPIHYASKCHAEKVYETLFGLGADGFPDSESVKSPINLLFDEEVIDKEFFFVDPYVDKPIDPIDDDSAKEAPGMYKLNASWFRSFATYLDSFITLTNDFPKVIRQLNHLSFHSKLFLAANSTKFFSDLLGRESYLKPGILFRSSPSVSFVFDLAFGPIFKRYYLDKLRTKSDLPSIVKTIVKMTVLNLNCPNLLQLFKFNAVYAVDAKIDLGTDVNCKTETGVSPLLTYLRQGGHNMAKVLVKHGVTVVDIQCKEFFEDSAFHLAAFHKLHYLQYISVFRDPVKWEEYLKEENALFDYLFDEYDKIKVGEQVKVVRVRDGPVTKAIKSHPQGYKVIDECLDVKGYTALHRAAQGGNVVAVKHFLDWGANLTIKTKDGFDALTLGVYYAVKYRPFLNLHKPSLLTSLEIEFASMTAAVILDKLTDSKVFDIGCDEKRSTPTLLHLVATRGMWRFIDELFVARNHHRVTGLTANCPTKDNITPMYLAKLHGGEVCDRDNPWCKVVLVLSQYGGSMVYPNPLTEYHLIFNALFHGFPEKLEKVLDHEELMNLRESCGQEECLKFNHNPANLVKELQQGSATQPPCGCISQSEKVFQDVARKIGSKETKIEIIKNDFVDFVSQSIEAMKQLVIAGVQENENLKKCKPQEKYDYNAGQSVTPSNLDMCSEKTTIHVKEVEAKLRTKYWAYINVYQSLNEELAHVRKVLTGKDIEPERYKDLNQASYLFERNYLCEWQTLTFEFAHLKFLLHVFDSWQKQVKRNSQYPSVSSFANQRIKTIFLNSNRKEIIELMIKLSKRDPSEHYNFLEMLRFHKPPMFNDL